MLGVLHCQGEKSLPSLEFFFNLGCGASGAVESEPNPNRRLEGAACRLTCQHSPCESPAQAQRTPTESRQVLFTGSLMKPSRGTPSHCAPHGMRRKNLTIQNAQGTQGTQGGTQTGREREPENHPSLVLSPWSPTVSVFLSLPQSRLSIQG